MQLQVVTLTNGKRPQEYLNTIEELKKSFIRSIDIVNKLRDLGLKYGLTKELKLIRSILKLKDSKEKL